MARAVRVVRLRDAKGRFRKGGPFRFMDLTSELRNHVYEHAVRDPRPAAEQEPGREHEEGCGPKCDCDIMSQVEHHQCANVTEAGGDDEIFHVHQVLPGPGSLFFLKADDCCTDVSSGDSMPGILEVSRQTRTEALGLFYNNNNTFVVDDAEDFVLKDWLFEVVGWENMKNVRRMFVEFDDCAPSRQVVLDYAVVILLMELGLLQCQLRVTFTTFRSDHIGCKLRKWIRELIAAKPIVKADVEGKDVGVAEALVVATAVAWKTLWLDDSVGSGEPNEEATEFCTVCELEEDGTRPHAPLFESI